MKPELIEKLKKLASQTCWADGLGESTIDDYAGGNMDDAYYGGETSGEVCLARYILGELGVEFTVSG